MVLGNGNQGRSRMKFPVFSSQLFRKFGKKPALAGYGLMLLIVFITSTVLIGTSMQILLGPSAAAYLGTSAQDSISAKFLAQSGMETVLADIQTNLNAGTTVNTSYTYSSANITMPTDPASLGGGASTIGSFSGTITSATGNTYMVKVTAVVGNATATHSKLVRMTRSNGSTVLDSMTNANAAYGLRKLRSGYGGSAIRVRRSSDNTEQDIGFDANGNLDMDSLKTFLSVSNPPLTTPTVALGLRRLRTAYTGLYAIRVRRSSDSTTQDIGFTPGGDLDVNALLNFVGTGTGYVTIMYDQSGNGTNAVQPTASNQPTIVTSGTLNMVANRPAIRYDGVNDYMYFSRTISDDFTISVSYSAIAGVNPFAGNPNWYNHASLVDADVGGIDNDFGMSIDSAGYVYAGVGNPDTTIVSQTSSSSVATPGLNDDRMHWAAMWRNKSTGAFGLYEDRFSNYGPDGNTPNANSLTAPTIVYVGGSYWFLNGYINEIIVYNSKLSETSLRTIQRNTAWYYNMPLHQWTGWSYPLNVVTGSTAAYGMRLLRSAYGSSGPIIKVRRSSDNATLDITSESGGYNLDVKSLLAFVGSGSGYIDTWYDQTVNARHATQPTTGLQPRIVNAGVLDMQNGKPAIYFPSGTYLRTAAFTAFGSGYHVQAIASASSNYANGNALVTKTNNNNYPAPFDFYSGSHLVGNGTASYASHLFTSSLTSGNPYWVYSYGGSSTSFNTWVNGLSAGASTGSFTYGDAGRGMFIGSREDYYPRLNGYIGEVITYGAQLSAANRQWLEQNQLQYYAAPLPTAFVTKWYDQSGNGYNAVQVSPVLQPTLVMPMYGTFNNRPTINFNGNQFLYTSGGMPTNADYSKVAVFSYFANGTGNIVSDTANVHALYMNSGNYIKLFHSGIFAASTLAMTNNTNYAVCGTLVNSSKLGTLYVYNTSAGAGTASVSNTSPNIQFGAHSGFNNQLFGTISEAMIFSRVLSTADRTAIYNDERGYFGTQ
jgi:hypothetical protein